MSSFFTKLKNFILMVPDADLATGAAADWKSGTFNGYKVHYLHIKPAEEGKATFLLLHGFPNGPSNYQYFIPELTSQGYGVVVPELLGYGDSDKPTELEAFSLRNLSTLLNELLVAEGVEKVVALGHDFGGPLAARFTQFYPEKTVALVLGGSPYAPPSPTPLDVDAVLKVVAPLLGYENIGYFKFFTADHAPKLLEEHLDSFVSVMFGPPAHWKEHVCKTGGLEERLNGDHKSEIDPWFTEKDREELTAYLRKTGLTGPTAWFRAAVSPINVGDYGKVDPKVHAPYLYISPNFDPSYPAPMAARQDALCDDITTKKIDTGHWIFEQDPKGAAALVLEWGKGKGLF